jgi:isoamylase
LAGVKYGYRVDGPQGWESGHRFDNNLILLDPYAKLIEGRRIFGDKNEKNSSFLGTYDFTLQFDWGDDNDRARIKEVFLRSYVFVDIFLII